MGKERIGIYPGTFDPITNGHMDIIQRSAGLVDRLVIGVADNDVKGPLFKTQERVEIISDELTHIANPSGCRIEVVSFSALLVQFAESVGASVIVRGLRAVADFDYEFQMTGLNARLAPDVETIFLMASDRHQAVSSRYVKEIAQFGGDVGHFVSPRVVARLKARLGLK